MWPPATTAIGALLNHITGGHIEAIDAGPRSFQPMNVNFGLFPPIVEPRVDAAGARLKGPERGFARKRALSARAEDDLRGWMERDLSAAPRESAAE
jgi:methylenetetrahydrofolate--tRNA-(uracil-5-)-methyltransferase